MKPLSFIIVGSGWRAQFFARIAKQYPQLFRLEYMLCRSEEKARLMSETCQIPTTTSVELCEAAKPDFVVTAVTKSDLYEVTKGWALKGYPVLCETPVGTSVEQLKEMWQLVSQKKIRVQVAEQYHRYPILAAGLRAIEEGKIGDPCAAVLSVAHDYHGASILRRALQIEPQPVKLTGKRWNLPVRETDSRQGPVAGGSVKNSERVLVDMEYACKKVAQYDFSGIQYHSFIRSRHINVQGQEGEWNDTMLRYVDADRRPAAEPLTAYLAPEYEALRNSAMVPQSVTWSPFLTLDGAQDEFAIASMMYDMRRWIDGGAEVYPMAEALEDAYTWLLIQEAAANPGKVIVGEEMPWHSKK
ncbi:MAG: Gfo/Idh/MocA family oxidoreductase [Lachnospiraceae bacterium]|nr:Gfo/Idh/MocA family oxidoreductase [Lachnospiraceae bacterium]